MITAEELENLDIFPKEYSCPCLFKFIFYFSASIFSFLLLFSFYTDSDIYSIINMNYSSKKDLIFNDYLVNKLIEENPKDFISENKTSFIQQYENLGTIFIKEYVMNSYPCLIKNSSEYFGVKEIIELVEEYLLKDKDIRITFEYRENPYTQSFDDDYKYIKTTYDNFLNKVKNNSPNYYFLNEYYTASCLDNSRYSIYKNYLDNNHLVNDLELKGIYMSAVSNFVVVWGHMETQDHFICLQEGSLDFVLIPPQEKKYVYSYNMRGPINYSRVNFFGGKNDIKENFPEFLKADKIYINLLKGECLYIPAFWWRSYRTNKNTKEKTMYLTYKYNSNSKYLDNLMYIRSDF